jgi:cytidylate kinase
MMRRLGAISTMTIEGSPGFSDPSPAVWNSALQSLTSDDYRQFIESVVEGLAQTGDAVIVGHAGQHILRNTPGVLKVFVHGSPTYRINRYAIEQGVARTEAEAAIKQSDKDRRNLLKTVYHFDWADASQYDLTINTDHLTDDWAIEAVVGATKALP